MRKVYKSLLTLLLCAVGVVNASAEKADLDPAMFKAWDSPLPGATAVAEPEECPNSDGSTSPFGCEYNMYEEIGAGAVVYGNTNVYYLWYADITGTKTLTIEGTAGLQLRILLNRPAAEEGGSDPHGGTTTELNVTLDDNGQGVLDLSGMEYIHLNCIKLGWGSPTGTIRKLELEGSVKSVTGWVNLINNSDMEGDDASSFFSKTAQSEPFQSEIKDGVGVDGSRGIVVEATEKVAEAWDNQFWFRFNEAIPAETSYRVSFDYKADKDATVSTQAHAEPSDYIHYEMFGNLNFTTAWNTFTYEGTVTASQSTAEKQFLSVAFNLSELAEANNYYFDNIVFEVFRESTPISLIKTIYGSDVVRIDFGKETNLKDLVKAAGGERLVYPDDIVKIIVNGTPSTIMSIEGRPDGYLYAFIDENYPEGEGEDVVSVSFTNPEDAAHQIIFTSGKYEGEPVPNFTDIIGEYDWEVGAGEYYSYLYATPAIESADPEDGSFNLPEDLKEFKFTFDHELDCKALVAKLEGETLTKNPAEGFSKSITLTRTGTNALKGVRTLTLSNVKGEKDLGEVGEYALKLSFGPIDIDPNDQPKDMIPDYMANTNNGGIPEGYVVVFGSEERTSENTYGSGSRMFDFAAGGDFTKALYFREGTVTYGTVENHELPLVAGKAYNIHFNSAMWKDNGTTMTFDILNDAEESVLNQTITNTPNVNGNTGAAVNNTTSTDIKFIPDADGNYFLRWTSSGFVEVLLANVSMKYVPDVLGIEETTLLATALENAKATLEGNSDSRYDGPAYDALAAKIKEYDGVTLTAPSKFRAAAAELDAASQAMKDHRALCDTYDPLPDQAQTIIDNNAEKKFAKTPEYGELKTILAKYGTKQVVTVIDPDTQEEVEEERVVAKELKDNAELQAAVTELQDIISFTTAMFTEGASRTGMTGYAVLLERTRVGIETAKALGVPETDDVLVRASEIFRDSNGMATELKTVIKKALYEKLMNGENIFGNGYNEETGEDDSKSYDMTVFVKNPNIYKLKASNNDYSQENVPGWTIVDGKGLTTGWTQVGSDKIPADAMVSNWGGSFTVFQTIDDLPAGIYTLRAGYGERDSEDNLPGSFFYAKTSDNVEDSLTVDCVLIGQAYPSTEGNLVLEDVSITDGLLTLGVQASSNSKVFFDGVKIHMTAAANAFDYKKAYEEVLAGIDETVVQNAAPVAMWLYDLNGRRVTGNGKGVFIVKKLMSDGTIRTEKVLKK